jgi:hypothetical protein
MSQTCPNRTFRPAWSLWLFLALLFLGQNVRAQDLDSRFLFIFDTSSDMKSRVKAEQFEMNQLLATAMNGQLHDGDSIGVWTFDQTVHAGQFPLLQWSSDSAHDIADNINKFIRDQHYSGTTSFAALKSLVGRVTQNSPRLTIIIFSDGEDNIRWTPYDNGINQIFQERNLEEKKDRQPFIVLIRSQLGKFTGCTMNIPPGMLNFPDFPPLPPPPQPVVTQPAPAPAPPPPAPVPLIIVGTNIMNQEPLPEPAHTPPPTTTVTNFVIQTNTVTLTNAVTLTNLPIPPKTPPPVVTPTPSDNSHFSHKGILALGAGFLIAAAGLIALAVSRNRGGDRSSLITRSMRKD